MLKSTLVRPLVICVSMVLSVAAYSAGSGTKSDATPAGRIGDAAPQINISRWVKQGPVEVTPGEGDKAYLIEFWATWCPHCVESVSTLSALQKEFGDDGLVVVAITDEEESVVEKFIKAQGSKLNYAVGIDVNQVAGNAYMGRFGVDGIPSVFLVDKKGKIVWVGHPRDTELQTQLSKLFPGDTKKSSASAPAKWPSVSHGGSETRSTGSRRSAGSGSK